MLRNTIEAYIQDENLKYRDIIIAENSSRVGKKIRKNQQFLEKFEHQIHNWLLKELPQSDIENEAVYAASLNIGNGSSRPQSLLGAASKMVRSALRMNLLT